MKTPAKGRSSTTEISGDKPLDITSLLLRLMVFRSVYTAGTGLWSGQKKKERRSWTVIETHVTYSKQNMSLRASTVVGNKSFVSIRVREYLYPRAAVGCHQQTFCTRLLFWLLLVPITVIIFNTERQIALYLAMIFFFSRGAVGSCSAAPGTCLLISGLKLNPLQGWRSAITQTGRMPGAVRLKKTSAVRSSRLFRVFFFSFFSRWMMCTVCGNRKRRCHWRNGCFCENAVNEEWLLRLNSN